MCSHRYSLRSREAVDLIYIDPPFATGADFSLPIKLDTNSLHQGDQRHRTEGVSGHLGRERGGSPSRGHATRSIRQVGLRDADGPARPIDRDRAAYMSTSGRNVSHLVRSCLDEVFGVANYRDGDHLEADERP